MRMIGRNGASGEVHPTSAMVRYDRVLAMLRAVIVLCAAGMLYAGSGSLDGDWTGAFQVSGQTLHFIVRIDGQSGTFESVDQHATVPLKSVHLDGRDVRIDMGIATFDGALDVAGKSIAGTFHQGAFASALTLTRSDKPLPKALRPQEPVRPFPYTEEDVTFAGGGGVVLAGTFTYPKQGGPFTTALLITGSGAQDRDEALLGHRPFLVLSDYLTRRGFAVLRLDDRGTGKSGGVFATTTYADKVADALAAVAWLKTRKEADPARLGLIGHSEGGTIAPMAAAESKDVAFVVMLAGIGVPGAQVLKQQGIDVTRAAGGTEAQVQFQVDMQQKLFDIWHNAASTEAAEKLTRELLGPAADGQIAAMKSRTFQDLLQLDPAPTLRKLRCSVLALNGSKDKQVAARQNLPAIAAALAESGSSDWSVVELPGLNHLFQTADKGSLDEYAKIEETIAPIALKTLGDWLASRYLQQRN